jgi:hypothetical protein
MDQGGPPKHPPSIHPLLGIPPIPDPPKPLECPYISNTHLRTALENRDAYDKLYLDISNKASNSYLTARRHRSVLHLNEEVAMLHL